MKILAASRLKLYADADEQMARAFIKSVADIDVGRKEHTSPDIIRFVVNGPADFMKAKAALTKRYGPPDTKNNVYGSHAGRWFVDAEKVIDLSDVKFGGGLQKDPYTIALYDAAHKESIHQMMRRVLGPPRVIPKRA